MERDAGLAGIDQDLESMASDSWAQWRDMLAPIGVLTPSLGSWPVGGESERAAAVVVVVATLFRE